MEETGHDKQLMCIDCGARFVFSAGEQEYYAKKRFTEPKRCQNCRTAARQRHSDRGGAGSRFDRGPDRS